jgi:uncharacterized protein YndB with AHSA1/START domain
VVERNDVVEHTGRKLLMTRVFAARRPLVFDAWTKPEHVAKWWGPRGFSLPSCEMDLRPGGAFRFVMRGPDGVDRPFEGVYAEVERPERIVFGGTIHDGVHVNTTVTFEDRGAETLVTVAQTFSAESDATRGSAEGWAQTLDRLGEALAAAR